MRAAGSGQQHEPQGRKRERHDHSPAQRLAQQHGGDRHRQERIGADHERA